MERFKASTHVSISVILPSGKNRRISFTPMFGGGSVYYCKDVEESKAIKKHYKYGKLFSLDSEFNPEDYEKPQKKSEEAMEKVVKVSDPDAAKAWLADNCGVSRTKLKSTKSIVEAAKQHGVVFEGLE